MEIIGYEDRHKEDFGRLNLEWLNKYNLAESHDLEVLDDPRGTIINRGGCVFLAMEGATIAGTAALMKEHDGVYELAKMGITEKMRGKGFSKLLIATCLNKAKEIGAKRLILFSNHQLQTALKLYEKFGFHHVEVKDSPFETADVKMELNLETN